MDYKSGSRGYRVLVSAKALEELRNAQRVSAQRSSDWEVLVTWIIVLAAALGLALASYTWDWVALLTNIVNQYLTQFGL